LRSVTIFIVGGILAAGSAFGQSPQTVQRDILVEDKTYETGRVTNRLITYRFNGEVFVKV
jgi:hypothetical protein